MTFVVDPAQDRIRLAKPHFTPTSPRVCRATSSEPRLFLGLFFLGFHSAPGLFRLRPELLQQVVGKNVTGNSGVRYIEALLLRDALQCCWGMPEPVSNFSFIPPRIAQFVTPKVDAVLVEF